MSDRQLAPAGWYRDPNGSGQRWWNGQAWHEPAAQIPPPPPPNFSTVGPGYAPPAAQGPPTAAQDRNWAMWSHLGTLLIAIGTVVLSAGLLSLFIFVFPLVMMNTVGNRSAWARAHAVEELNLQLSVLLYSLVFLLGAAIITVATLGLGLLLVIPLALALFIWYVVDMIMATTAASRAEFRRYPLAIRFVK